MTLADVCIAIGDSRIGTELRESLWVFPLLETLHVLALALMTGTIAIFDLRLLGVVLRGEAVAAVYRRVWPLVWIGTAVMMGTGALLFWAGAAKLYANPAFRWKLVLLVLAGLNPVLFHLGVGRTMSEWGPDVALPVRARLAGAASLLLWSGVIITGRAIAYM